MPADEHRFTTVGGVPVHYDRQSRAQYGTKGKACTMRCTHAFYRKLDACFSELWRVSPNGRAQVVTSAGAYVNKSGYHGYGRAFDLDGIFWSGRTFITNNFPSYPNYYLGVEAVLRKHFGTVLAYNFNNAHHDHFHFDDGTSVGFRKKARSVVLFVQGVCYYIFGMRFRGNVDGKWGDATDEALKEACRQLGVPTPLTTLANWNRFLDAVALKGMGVTVINMPPMVIHGHANRLVFDGRALKWIRGGNTYKSWPAVSGRPGFQSKRHQRLKDKGPLPEGKWAVRRCEYQRMAPRSWIERIAAELGRTAWPGGKSAWGRNRVWLHPLPGTNTYGRSGFSIHGGDSPGSAGCIDLTSSMPDFTREFLKHGKDLELEVRYRA